MSNTELIIVIASVAAILVLIAIFFTFRPKKKTVKPKEEETLFSTTVDKGCPEAVKRKLLKEQELLLKEAHKVYMVIKYALEGKPIPPEVKKELQTFLRAYNRLEEMKEEIELYPFGDCERVFNLKFDFYSNLIHSTAQKILALTKKNQ